MSLVLRLNLSFSAVSLLFVIYIVFFGSCALKSKVNSCYIEELLIKKVLNTVVRFKLSGLHVFTFQLYCSFKTFIRKVII